MKQLQLQSGLPKKHFEDIKNRILNIDLIIWRFKRNFKIVTIESALQKRKTIFCDIVFVNNHAKKQRNTHKNPIF